MKLSSNLNNGLIEELDRLCGTSINNYTIKSKLGDINSAQDWYFDLAESASRPWNFDDSNKTTPPIDTQNIVSGTNRYKFSAFTEEITDLLKLEVLDSAGKGLTLTPDTLDSNGNLIGNISGQISGYTGQSFQERYLNAPSGTPTNYLKYGNFLYLYPNPNYNYTAGLKSYFNRPAGEFSFVSYVANVDNTLTALAHGLSNGDTVIVETDGTVPTGLTVDTQYYVVSSTTNTFKLALTSGGTEIDITNAQTSSNQSFLHTSKSPGFNSTHHDLIVNKAAQRFMTMGNTGGVYNARLSMVNPMVMQDEKTIQKFYANRNKDQRQRLTAKHQDNR